MAVRWGRWFDRRKQPVAFVLSGGGPLGAVQIGLLQALFEKGVSPDMVIGVSVGALNAVFIANNPSVEGAEALGDVWRRMRKDDLFPGGRLISAWHAVRRGSYLFSNAGLRRIIEGELPAQNFEDLALPAHIAAAKLETGEEAWFSSGRILEPLLASSAMPGVFPPVSIDGVSYVDGGIANNVPISKAVELGARRIFVLNVKASSQDRPLNHPHEFMMHGLVLARSQRYKHDLEWCSREAEVIELPFVDVGHVPFTDLSQTQRLIGAGRNAGRAFLEGELRPARAAAGSLHPSDVTSR